VFGRNLDDSWLCIASAMLHADRVTIWLSRFRGAAVAKCKAAANA
jgi:hypothetical protein